MTKILAFVSFAATMSMLSADAGEITFTGADAANPTNLSSAANWSAAPSAAALEIVDRHPNDVSLPGKIREKARKLAASKIKE